MIRNQAIHAHAPIGRQPVFGIAIHAICPSCAHEHPDDARVCTECGTPLTLAVCAACEAINAIDAVSCHQCGARLAGKPGSADAAPAPWSADVEPTPWSADVEPAPWSTEAAPAPWSTDVDPASWSVDAAPAPWSVDAAPATAADDFREPPTEATFVLDTVEKTIAAQSDAEDDVIALGEKRYVGPDALRRALPGATPIAFAERVGHALSLAGTPSFGSDATSDIRLAGRHATRRRAHLGVALALVIVAGVSGYWAFDVPKVRGVIATTLARANAIAPRRAPQSALSSIERADNAQPPAPATPSPASSPRVPEMQPAAASPAIETVTETSAPPARASSDAPANEVAPAPIAHDLRTAPGVSTKKRNADARRGSISRVHPQSSPHPPDRDALETQRLIERDLGRFLAK